jgi:hypothetical protein
VVLDDSLYAWQVYDEDERWGVIAAVLPVLAQVIPLVHRDEEVVRSLAHLARDHAATHARPVRLARFGLTDVLEEL